jgi:hypothetical protein
VAEIHETNRLKLFFFATEVVTKSRNKHFTIYLRDIENNYHSTWAMKATYTVILMYNASLTEETTRLSDI